MNGKGHSEPEDDGIEPAYRELFSPEEAHQYAQPERLQLPTQRIAIWSIGASLLLAGALVVSWFVERSGPVARDGAGRQTKKNAPLNVPNRAETDTASYLR